MVYRVTICKEVLIDADDDFPTGDVNNMTREQIDYIWKTVENNHFQIDEEITEVY